jgi:hypothetical protein
MRRSEEMIWAPLKLGHTPTTRQPRILRSALLT